MKRLVICAAMRSGDVIVAGARHFDCVMRSQINAMSCDHTWEQGFIDQFGVFMSRQEAWKVADAVGQIRRATGLEKDYSLRPANVGDEGMLFSENLY